MSMTLANYVSKKKRGPCLNLGFSRSSYFVLIKSGTLNQHFEMLIPKESLSFELHGNILTESRAKTELNSMKKTIY